MPSFKCSSAASKGAGSTKRKQTKKETKADPKEEASEAQKPKKTGRSKKTPPTQVKRIRLYPSKEDESTLRKWFGCCRKTYNWALGCIKAKPKEYKINHFWLRKRFINKERMPKKLSYLLETPKAIRDEALKELVGGYKSNFAKRKENPTHTFEMHFRKKRDTQAITIPSELVKVMRSSEDPKTYELHMFPTFLTTRLKYHCRQRDLHLGTQVSQIDYYCKLVQDKLGRFYLCVPQLVTSAPNACENQAGQREEGKWVALDPGVRTFLTGYSPTPGDAFQIADGDKGRLVRLCQHMDSLHSKAAKAKGRRKKRMEKALQRMRYRLQHCVDEVHWKAVHFLTHRYQAVILPTFETSQMVCKTSRKINSKTVRSMLSWRHYTFQQRLLQKAKERNVEVALCGEQYTSKTCTQCFRLHPSLGGNKHYNCSSCGVKYDRDIGGARNIFLKNSVVELTNSTTLPR